jgi:hypothetical protein
MDAELPKKRDVLQGLHDGASESRREIDLPRRPIAKPEPHGVPPDITGLDDVIRHGHHSNGAMRVSGCPCLANSQLSSNSVLCNSAQFKHKSQTSRWKLPIEVDLTFAVRVPVSSLDGDGKVHDGVAAPDAMAFGPTRSVQAPDVHKWDPPREPAVGREAERPSLTSDQRQRIYEEEKLRLEIREQLKREQGVKEEHP